MQQALKRLTRSRRERVFGGICGGLAAYLGWDAVLVRVAWVVLTVLSVGSGVALYLLTWIIIPLEPLERLEEPAHQAAPRSDTRTVLGVLAVVIGLLALSSAFLPWFWRMSSFRVVGPLVLILIGAALLLRPSSATGRDAAPAPSSAESPPPPSRPEAADRSHRRLVRIHQGRKIAGVCNGLGAYFAVDPTVVRLLWIVLVLAGGAGILIYLLLWIVMPLSDRAPDDLMS
jgi:phage shock protein C